MEWLTAAFTVLATVEREILMFALVGLLIGGMDDLIMDMLFIGRTCWRKLFIYSRFPRMTSASLPPADQAGRFAVFIPAWKESHVIGGMLHNSLKSWPTENVRLFVGTYPNDPATIEVVKGIAERDSRVHLITLPHPGGTTKADCLNHLWPAMLQIEEEEGVRFKGVILHDAEDVVHADEIRLFDRLIERFDMVQLPVVPILSAQSRWVAGHYADEFAESHRKTLILREAVGAAVPSAGVGCCFSRDRLAAIALRLGGRPFDPSSLTEDYEIGLRIREQKGKTAFVTMTDAEGKLICTQEHFPETFKDAVDQKARWIMGIALAGWDRMGWHGTLIERWMRLHDRRAVLSVLVLAASYCAILGYAILLLAELAGIPIPDEPTPLMDMGLIINFYLMSWRVLMRAFWSTVTYGWREGLRAIPRVFIANGIAIAATRHAIDLYRQQLKDGKVRWAKTNHRFPEHLQEADVVGG